MTASRGQSILRADATQPADRRSRMTRPLLTCLAAAALACVAGFSASHAQESERAYPRAELDETHDRAEVSAGGVTARLSIEPRLLDGYTEAVPLLEVRVGGKVVARAEGVSAGADWRQGTAEIVEMDRSNKAPEVVFSSYSGGAHCCTRVIIAAADAKGQWSTTAVGDWDGGGDYIEDADGDGVAEIAVIDNAFLYTFDCYACSAAPLKILAVHNGRIVDATREPRFRKKHEAWLKAMESWASDRDSTFAPGFFAGWVAQKSLLGEGRQAWDAMMKAYDAKSDLGHEICKDGQPLTECPEKDQIAVPFPKALKIFLEQRGYNLTS